MLKLRAAEVELIEVMSIRPFEVARSIVRRTSERNLVSLGYGDTEHGSVRKAFEKALKETRYEGKMFTAEEWTICARRVGDSLVELDNAESVLSQHPKSRWWWWIFAVLKSRAVEYLYTLRYIRAIGSNEGYGAAPHIIPPSAFRFAENGLIRVVLEKDLGDIFYLARVISSLTTIIRMDYSHATLRSEPGKKFMESWCKSVRQRIGLNVAALSELVNRLDQLLLESAALHPDSHHDVISYAQTSRARADKLLKAWELLPR
jgi:hypothetical protein